MSLRIAIVVPVAYEPGEETRWSTLAHRYIPLLHAQHLAERGHEVHVFFDGPERVVRPAPSVLDDFASACVEPRFTIHVLSSRVPAFGGVVRSTHLVRAAGAVRPDVLHLHNLFAAENVAAAVLLPCPVFAEFHGGQASRFALRRALLRWASARLAAAFFAAPEHAEPALAAGALSRSTIRLTSPEATSRFDEQRLHPPAPPGSPHFLVVGRCERPKDPQATLATFRALARRLPGAQLTWASPGGAETAAVKAEIAADPTLALRVTFGRRSLADMPATYAAADVTLITSEAEIGATVVSESLSQGTPVAAFDLPAIRALGKGTTAVRLVGERHPERLAETALELAGRPELREDARAHFEARLSFSAIARDRSRAYEEAAARSI